MWHFATPLDHQRQDVAPDGEVGEQEQGCHLSHHEVQRHAPAGDGQGGSDQGQEIGEELAGRHRVHQ